MGRALIICDSLKGTEFFRDFLRQNGYEDLTIYDSESETRQRFSERDFDICIINSPLQGQSCEGLAIDIAEKNECQVLLFVKSEILQEVTAQVEEYGIITVARPVNQQIFWTALKLAGAAQRRIALARQENQKLRKKLEDLKVISRAKCLMVSYEGITEAQAHKYIEKHAMDSRMSRADVAKEIISRYE